MNTVTVKESLYLAFKWAMPKWQPAHVKFLAFPLRGDLTALCDTNIRTVPANTVNNITGHI